MTDTPSVRGTRTRHPRESVSPREERCRESVAAVSGARARARFASHCRILPLVVGIAVSARHRIAVGVRSQGRDGGGPHPCLPCRRDRVAVIRAARRERRTAGYRKRKESSPTGVFFPGDDFSSEGIKNPREKTEIARDEDSPIEAEESSGGRDRVGSADQLTWKSALFWTEIFRSRSRLEKREAGWRMRGRLE